MKNKLMGILIGIIIGSLFTVGVIYADDIDVLLNSVFININGTKVLNSGENYKLSNGDEVPSSLVYNGTTYLPVRKLSELLGKEILWDNDTKTIDIVDEAVKKSSGSIKVMESVKIDKTDEKKPVVTFNLADGSIMKAELYPDVAPITVENFIKLIDSGFYDSLNFHRIISGFVVQGGDPLGNGTGGPGWSIKGEFSSNGFENNLKHERGVLSMARSLAPDSAGSQFFIMHGDAPHLDGEYAAFGRIIEGIEVVDKIAAAN